MCALRLSDRPFTCTARKDGSIDISHEGRSIMVVTGAEAARLARKLAGASAEEVQMALAKITGNFKRGNERIAANHVRNR
jgi:hypothetical protein